jgi:hypothetical protein
VVTTDSAEVNDARRLVDTFTRSLVEGRRRRRESDIGVTILSLAAAGEAFLMVNAINAAMFYGPLVGLIALCVSLTYTLRLRGMTVDKLALNAADWCEARAQYDRLIAGEGQQ